MTSDDQPSAPALPPVHPALSGALAAQGYDTLTPVQLAVLNEDAGADLLVSAQTGSGKTVAFGLAIAPTLLGDERHFGPPERPLGLVIAPTRELAMQVQREFDWLYAGAGVVTASAVGGMDQRTERRALERGAHIVVGTPGRLRDHITRHALDLGAIRAIVLDEADEMLDLGFREDLEFILAAAPPERRTLLFSATLPPPIVKLASKYQRDAARIQATPTTTAHQDISIVMHPVAPREREHAVVNVLRFHEAQTALVFVAMRETVTRLHASLVERGFSAVALSGELSQNERNRALQAVRDGRARVLVCTDVAARGLDLPEVSLVVHGDVAENSTALTHRNGRTGGAGKKGTAVILATGQTRFSAERQLYSMGVKAHWTALPTPEQIAARDRQRTLERLVDDAAHVEGSDDDADDGLAAALLEKFTPRQLAGLVARGERSRLPAPEDVDDSVALAARAQRQEHPPQQRQAHGPGGQNAGHGAGHNGGPNGGGAPPFKKFWKKSPGGPPRHRR
jgi:ATP-dependent RNA helicase DeaD